MARLNTITIDKKKYVVIPEEECKLMMAGPPPLPDKLSDGNYPALPAIEASIARGIVRDRQTMGLSQKELAQAAGIRVEVLNRAERCVVVPSLRTLTKIENALVKAGMTRKRV